MRARLRFLGHNVVVHPLAGVAWFLGADALGDWLHGRLQEPRQ